MAFDAIQPIKSTILPFNGPAAWKGKDLKNCDDLHITINKDDVDEIMIAVKRTIDQNIAIADITKATFSLPNFGRVLTQIYDEIVHGRGVKLLHGMPVDESLYTRDEIIRAYIGIGSWLGEPVSQNHKGHIVGHVKDIGADPKNTNTRVYATAQKQPYHTDSADLVGLLCLKPSKSGGIFSVSSIYTIYNEMLAIRPDLVEVLEAPFIIDRKGEIPEGKQATFEMAVFHRHEGRLLSMHDRNFIDAALARENAIPLTTLQKEALDLFDEIAARDDVFLDLEWQPGDLGFVHNHQCVHARTDYEDFPDIKDRRHLIRLWLSTNHGWSLPDVFSERYGSIKKGQRRGGIVVPGMQLTCPLEAE